MLIDNVSQFMSSLLILQKLRDPEGPPLLLLNS